MTKTWKVIDLEKLTLSETVIKIIYSLTIDNGIVSHKMVQNVTLERTEDSPEFIPFAELTEEIVLEWVKSKLGEEGISNLEQRLLNILPVLEERLNRPQTERGLPWN